MSFHDDPTQKNEHLNEAFDIIISLHIIVSESCHEIDRINLFVGEESTLHVHWLTSRQSIEYVDFIFSRGLRHFQKRSVVGMAMDNQLTSILKIV